MGTLLLAVPPLPSTPSQLAPHAATVPSAQMAKLWSAPAAMEVTDLPDRIPEEVMAMGTWLSSMEPSPSWPLTLNPQEARVPFEHKARL